MRRMIVMLLALLLMAGCAHAEPCIAKDGTCPLVVAPTKVFVPEEGAKTGVIDGMDGSKVVVSEMAMLPWKGAIVVGTLPKDAEIVETLQDDYGYAQTLLYDGVASIVTARFGSVEARDAFLLENYLPNGEYEILEDVTEIAGAKPLHIRYAVGGEEDARVVDAFYFANAENFFLFLTAIDADAYAGTEYAYGELVPVWLSSLAIVTL